MKRILLFLTCFLTLFGLAHAEDVLVQQCLFGSQYNSAKIQTYTDKWTATNKNFTWDIANCNNNQNGWDYVKAGNKNNASVATITTQKAIDEAISKVGVLIGAITANSINSVTLYVADDSDFTSNVQKIPLDKKADSKTEQEVTIPTPKANQYYKLEMDCAKGSANGLIQINQISYYKAETLVEPDKTDAQLSFSGVPPTINVGKSINLADYLQKSISYTGEIKWSVEPLTLGTLYGSTFTAGNNPGKVTITAEVDDTENFYGSASCDLTIVDPSAPAAQEVTFDFTTNDYEMTRQSGTSQTYNGDEAKIVNQDGFVITNYKSNSTKTNGNGSRLWSGDGLRCYSGTKLIISSDIYTITEVTITSASNTDFSVGQDGENWVIEYTPTSSNKSLNTITIKYTPKVVDPQPEKTPVTLSFDPASMEVSLNDNADIPTLTIGGEGVNAEDIKNYIEYTVSGTEGLITGADGNYTANTAIAGSATIKASLKENADYTCEADATFTLIVTDPDAPVLEPKEVTFDFANNSYGETVRSGNDNSYSANGTVIEETPIKLEINPGKAGAGCRFWQATSGQEFRIMKGSNIRLFIDNGTITEVAFTGGTLVAEGASSASNSWKGSANSITFTNPSDGSTVSLTGIKVVYILNSTSTETPALGEIVAVASDEQKIEDDGEITIKKGTSITFTAANASKIELLEEDMETVVATSEGSDDTAKLVWTPTELYSGKEFVVNAEGFNAEGKEASDMLYFTLTVENPELGEIVVKHGNTIVDNESTPRVHVGTVFTISAENATSMLVEALLNDDDVETLAEVQGSTAKWVVDKVYDNIEVHVTAWVDKENEPNNNKAFEFYPEIFEAPTDEDHVSPKVGDEYTLITSTDDLIPNCHYVMAYTGGKKAMSNEGFASGKMSGTDVDIEENVLTANDTTLVFNLTEDEEGNYTWNFLNYGNQRGNALGASDTDLTVTTGTPSTVTIDEEGNATIIFAGTPTRQILWSTDATGFKNYASSNNGKGKYFTVQLYKLSKWELTYEDFTHEFEDVTVGLDKTIVLFDDEEKYPTTLVFVPDDPSIVEITPDGKVTGKALGNTDVKVTWAQDAIFAASPEEGYTFNVEVIEELSAMFDYNVENAYGMTTTTDGNKYEEDSISATVELVTMTLNGRYRSWKASPSNVIDLRLFKTETNKDNAGTLTFSVPKGYKLETVEFTAEDKSITSYLSASVGEIDGLEWRLSDDDAIVREVTFTASGTVRISTATVNYAVAPVYEPVKVEIEPNGYEWNSDGFKVQLTLDGVEKNDLEVTVSPKFTAKVKPSTRPATFDVNAWREMTSRPDKDIDAYYYADDKMENPVEIDWNDQNIVCVTVPCSGLYELKVEASDSYVGQEFDAVVTEVNVHPTVNGISLNTIRLMINEREHYGDEYQDDTFGYPYEKNNPDKLYNEDDLENSIIRFADLYVYDKLYYKVTSLATADQPQGGVDEEAPLFGKRRRITSADDLTKAGYVEATDADTTGEAKDLLKNLIDLSALKVGDASLDVVVEKNGSLTPMVDATNSENHYSIVRTKIQPTEVGTIEAEVADGEAEYYTLQGVKVQNPDKGIYIKLVAGKASKVVI